MSIDLRDINITSGVNEAGQPFLTVAASGDGGTILVGQLSPPEVRRMALAWLESAEAAEQDAAVLRVIRVLGLPDQMAGLVIVELRESRSEG